MATPPNVVSGTTDQARLPTIVVLNTTLDREPGDTGPRRWRNLDPIQGRAGIAAARPRYPNPAASLTQLDEATKKALALHDNLPDAISMLGGLAWLRGNYDEALEADRRST